MKKIQTALAFALSLGMGFVWAAEPTMSEKSGQISEPQATTESPAVEASAPETMANTGTVSRAAFTSAVENREPTDRLSSLNNDQSEIMYFTELRDMAGQSVTHRWEHDGKVMAEIPFNVGGNRWRVYSSKQLDSSWTGSWKASVISANGETLSVSTFNYETAPEAPAATEATPASPATTESQSTTQ